MSRWLTGSSLSPVHRLDETLCWSFRKTIAVILTALLLARGEVIAQDEPTGPTTEISRDTGQLSSRPGRLPADAYRSDPAVGVRYRDLFRDTRTPFRQSGQTELDSPLTGSIHSDIGYEGPVSGFRTNVNVREPIPLEGSQSVRTSFDVMGLRLGYGLTGSHGFNLLGRGFEPQDADMRLGPLFFKLRALTGAVLMSDNVNQREFDREKGAISIARISGTVVAQFTESLRLSATGSLIWLPFKGKVGFTTSSGYFDFDFGGEGRGSLPLAQIDWEGKVGEWTVFVTDTFHAYSNQALLGGDSAVYENSLFEGESFEEFDSAGRYRYGGEGRRDQRRDRDFEVIKNDNRQDFEISDYYSNSLEVGAERLFPGPVRLQLRAHRQDLWYNQGARGGPSVREGATVFVRSERDNMRFKPYARYEINRTDLQPEWSQLIIAGLTGPITDQLFLRLYAGQFIGGGNGRTSYVAGMSLHHVAGPYTYESLFIGREIDDYYEIPQIVDRITYNIHQILGPKLFADAYASYETTSALDDRSGERNRIYAGIRLTLLPGPRTSAQLSYTYRQTSTGSLDLPFSDGNQSDDEDFSGAGSISQTIRLKLRYEFTDSLHGQLFYEFRDVDSSAPNQSYYENLVILSLNKYFY